MRSDHLSKHIKTHQNKKGGASLAIITTEDMEDSNQGLGSSPRIVTVETLSQDSAPATPTASSPNQMEGEEEEEEEEEFWVVTSDHFLFRDKAGRAKFLVGLHGYAVAVEVRWSIFFKCCF